VVHNQSSNHGAGIEVDDLNPNDTFAITHSTLTDNTATGSGGGFVLDGQISGTAEIVDSTISGNHAAKGAGGAFGVGGPSGPLITGGSFALNNSTVADNEATEGGGLYLDHYLVPADTRATVRLNSTIVADNTAAGNPDDLGEVGPPATGGGFALSFSLIETPGAATLLTPGTSLTGTDPQLGTLGNNGGPTETQLPANSSPVVDKGQAAPGLATDQRGDPRTAQRAPADAADGTDIGAVELPTDGTGAVPDTRITSGPKKKVKTKKRKAKVTIAFTSDQPGSTFQCKVDNGSFQSCTSPFTTKLKAKSGKGKKHTIEVRAVGPTGAVDLTPATVTVKAVKK
jgi:hypothetical protein